VTGRSFARIECGVPSHSEPGGRVETPDCSRPSTAWGNCWPKAARRWPRRTALVTDDRTLTFEELDQLASQVAHGLSARGVRLGDRVALLSQNRWEWIVAYHGPSACGAVVNPLNVMLTGAELDYIRAIREAKVLLASGERLRAVGAALGSIPGLEEVISFDDRTRRLPRPSRRSLPLADSEPFEPVPVDPGSTACIATPPGRPAVPRGPCSRIARWC